MTCSKDAFFFCPLNLSSLDPNSFILKQSKVLTKNAFNNIDDHSSDFVEATTVGRSRSLKTSKKLYAKSTVEPTIVFLNPASLSLPAVLVKSPSPVMLNNSSYSYSTDQNRMVVSNAAAEDLAIYLNIAFNTGNIAAASIYNPIVRMYAAHMTPMWGSNFFTAETTSSTNQSQNFAIMAPKAAHPFFAAVPIKSNRFTYGPWTNYPLLDKGLIFPDASEPEATNAIENLIGGTDVQINNDYAPWNYGGMVNLDTVVHNDMSAKVQYQQIIEMGSINMPGLPIFGLAAPFSNSSAGSGFNYNGQEYTISTESLSWDNESYNIPYLKSAEPSLIAPIITQIQTNVDPNAVGTTYGFRTYVQKLGFFNKESNDRLKKVSQNIMSLRKSAFDIGVGVNSSIVKEIQTIKEEIVADKPKFTAQDFKSKFFATSPGWVLAGAARPYIPNIFDLEKAVQNAKDANNADDAAATVDDPEAKIRSTDDRGIKKSATAFQNNNQDLSRYKVFRDLKRYSTFVGLFPANEIPAEATQKYPGVAIMSLDGLLSPVSFFPTEGHSTFAMMPTPRKHCPYCKGAGVITDNHIDIQNNVPKVSNVSVSSMEFPCPYCQVKLPIPSYASKTAKFGGNTGELLPPYIITNNNDISNLSTLRSAQSTSSGSSDDSSVSDGLNLAINSITLNPVTMPEGIFRNINSQYSNNATKKESLERCRHCIEVIGRGMSPPKTLSISAGLHKIQAGKPNPDYSAIDGVAGLSKANTNSQVILNNQRFFGLRGPLVMHAWGYDVDGYPVPNESDEPQTDGYGREFRFTITVSVDGGNIKYEKLETGDLFILATESIPDDHNQLAYRVKTPNDAYDDLELAGANCKKIIITNNLNVQVNTTTGWKNKGDILTKQWEWQATKYVKKDKSTKFALNWAERQDIWPVGPVDLRWDNQRRVWTVPSSDNKQYKLVYVTLEEDMIKDDDYDVTYAARGFLDDIEYNSETLPVGYRRLVYIRDRAGYTAPRGTKILCKYMPDSGFYEPISKPSVIAKGVVASGNTATLDMHYVQGRQSGVVPTMVIKFDNPMKFAVASGKVAMFTFINGKWTLTSIN